MKKILTIILGSTAALLLAIALLAPKILGFSVSQLGAAVQVATGMGAKLACSARFVSGFEESLVIEDLASYSPANRLLNLQYGEKPQRVTATLLGMAETSATYRPGLGCALDIGDISELDRVAVTAVEAIDGEWPVGNQVRELDSDLQQRASAQLARDNVAGLQTRALVIVQNGKIVAESYASGIDAETPLLGWSMGKSLTAILLGRMETMGLTGPANTSTDHLFPRWEQDARANISLENLLQMSSGLNFDETYAPGSDATHMLFAAHSAANVALQSPALYPPAEHFSYSSGTSNLIARWMHDQLGGSVQASVDFFSREILQPLGMSHTVFETDPSGVFVGSSYIYASARDWARLGQLMLNNGNWNGKQLLSESWVKRASAPNISSNEPRYGYQFWLNGGGDSLRYPQLPRDAYFMQGNRSQVVMISPSTGTVVVRLGWTAGDYPTDDNFAELLPRT